MTSETAFFMPDGNGGALPADKAERTYQIVRRQAETGYWGGTFTDRRVLQVVSDHNGQRFVNRVGDLTSDKKFVLAIFQSLDEHGRERYVVQSLHTTIHIDRQKVVSVEFFEEAE